MTKSGRDKAEESAKRLSFELQFTELREALETIPGITATLPQLGDASSASRERGGWVQCFDIEPSEKGIEALVGLTETLNWCAEHHARLGLPAFDSIVAFAAGFVLNVTPESRPSADDLGVPPDVLARAIRENYASCVEKCDAEAERWELLQAECIDDFRGSRPGLAAIDDDRFSFDLVDPAENVVAVILDGRPVARYRFEEGEERDTWQRLDPADSGPQESD